MSRSDGSTADYYVLPEGATQLQDLISHRNLNAQLGEIFRACYRFGLADHSDQLRDAKKIRFYAQAEVERLEKLTAVVEEPSHIPAHASIAAADHPYNQPSHIISDIPSWDDAPEWAMWLGQNYDGEWEFYEDKPVPKKNFWYHELRGSTTDHHGASNPFWYNTLQSRPTSTTK